MVVSDFEHAATVQVWAKALLRTETLDLRLGIAEEEASCRLVASSVEAAAASRARAVGKSQVGWDTRTLAAAYMADCLAARGSVSLA